MLHGMTQRIGIFGGTFDPVHIGHLVMAQDALERFELDQVLWVPCKISPHKPGGSVASGDHRAAMLDLAVEGDPRLEVSRVELERGGVSYTIDTVRFLQGLFPDAQLVLIVGSDTLLDLTTWRAIDDLLDCCEVVTLARPGTDLELIKPSDLRFRDIEQAVQLLARSAVGHLIDISSTEIRMRLAEGLSIRYLVPDPVAMYIAEHRLYNS